MRRMGLLLGFVALVQGCGSFGPDGLQAGPRGSFGAASVSGAGISFSAAYLTAQAYLAQQAPGENAQLTDASNAALDRQGLAAGGQGWLFDFLDASASYGIRVGPDGSVATFADLDRAPALPANVGNLDIARLIALAYPDPTQQGPFAVALQSDAQGQGPVALIGLGPNPSQAIWANFGQPYSPSDPDVAAHLLGNLQRVLGAYWDSTLDPTGSPTVAVASLVAMGAVTAAQIKVLDPTGSGQIGRAAFVGMAAWSTALYNFDALVGNCFRYATGGTGSMTPAQATFDISLGARATSGSPPPRPLILHVAIPAAAFAQADRDGDGRLTLDEAMVPIADALGQAYLTSPAALAQGASFTADALPWAHY